MYPGLLLSAMCWHVCDVMREKLRNEHSDCLELISQYNSESNRQISKRRALLYYSSLIGSHIGLSIGTDLDDLEWPWTV